MSLDSSTRSIRLLQTDRTSEDSPRTKVDVNLHRRKKKWTIKNLYGNVYLAFFCIFMNFYFVMYYIFLHTDLRTRRKNTKKGKENYIYIHRRLAHNYILIKKKERNTPQYLPRGGAFHRPKWFCKQRKWFSFERLSRLGARIHDFLGNDWLARWYISLLGGIEVRGQWS